MTQIFSKPCICTGCQGTMYYAEQEDYNPGSEYEWSMHYSWCCDTCMEYVSDADERFEWPD
jgi:hypothetical protein